VCSSDLILVPEPVYREVMDFLEFTERRHFGRLRGRYVRTGATRASLTGSGGGAIRAIRGTTMDFGTTVRHAHFLTKAPRDPNSGQVRKEPPGKGLSAVLVFSRSSQKKVGRMVMDHIVEPFGDA